MIRSRKVFAFRVYILQHMFLTFEVVLRNQMVYFSVPFGFYSDVYFDNVLVLLIPGLEPVNFQFVSILPFFIVQDSILYVYVLQGVCVHTFLYSLIYFIFINQMSRVFANGPGDRGSIPGRVILKTQKMVLNTALLQWWSKTYFEAKDKSFNKKGIELLEKQMHRTVKESKWIYIWKYIHSSFYKVQIKGAIQGMK